MLGLCEQLSLSLLSCLCLSLKLQKTTFYPSSSHPIPPRRSEQAPVQCLASRWAEMDIKYYFLLFPFLNTVRKTSSKPDRKHRILLYLRPGNKLSKVCIHTPTSYQQINTTYTKTENTIIRKVCGKDSLHDHIAVGINWEKMYIAWFFWTT